jgi:acyl-CoA dehydrogenase
MTEPGAGSDLKAITMRARRDGEDYVLDGTKTFITNGFTASVVVTACRTGGAGAGGISLLIVPTQDMPGFSASRFEKIGQHASDTAELSFDGVRVPAANLLGEEGAGFGQLMSQLAFERMLLAIPAAAAIDRALELTLAHTRERKMFGGTLFELQNTRFRLAEVATSAHVVRSFVNDCTQRLVDGTLDPEAAYMAKLWCTEQQGKVMDECLQLFGGYGYMTEYPIARLYVDARVQRIYGGANEVMKELISRAL